MHVSKANELAQIVVLLSKVRDAKIARTVPRIIRLSSMAAPFRCSWLVDLQSIGDSRVHGPAALVSDLE